METCDFQVFLVEFRGSCQVPGLFSPTRVTGIELEWQAKHLLQRVNDRAKRTRMTTPSKG